MLTRMFAYFTVFCYLVVGTMVARFCLPESAVVSISGKYLELVSTTQFQISKPLELEVPEMHFAEIKIPQINKTQVIKRVAKQAAPKMQVVVVKASFELPFHEPVKLQKIEMNHELPTNMVALYNNFKFSETLVAQNDITQDSVSTTQSVAEEVEPEFFEYPVVEKKKEVTVVVKEEKVVNEENSDVSSIETEEIADLVEPETEVNVAITEEVKDPEVFDFAAAVTTQDNQQIASVSNPNARSKDNASSSEFIGFDYSQAKKDITENVVPKISKVDSQKSKAKSAYTTNPQVTPNPIENEKTIPDEESPGIVPDNFPVTLSIRALGTNLNKMNDIKGFEVRFQDDLSETREDYGSGEVIYETLMNNPKMTRSVTLLKRGFIPTTTEVILEEGNGSVSIPMLEEEVFNNLMLPHERQGLVGGLLLELDDETEVAKIDVPFGEVITLNGDFKRTTKNDFRYQLFLGVKSGNALVSYHKANREVVSKIIHIHEHELNYDSNFYEEIQDEKVKLLEEDLLARENSPLIIPGNQVKVFAQDRYAKKISNNIYKVPFGLSHLGGRRYIELNHHSEPVFVGIRDNSTVSVPSESFMRFMLSKIEGSKLGNRCLVQVNLSKEAEKYEIASESVSQSLMVYTQALDSDGKFYDSLSSKTRKIIAIGESQGSAEISPDSKINIKVQYVDGTVQFLNSYCSPNTYLVEQL